MHCFICDALLSEEEIRFNRDHKDYDPCNTCKEIIKDAVHEAHDPDEVEDLGDLTEDDAYEMDDDEV